jgi:site-specific DNA recombinase
MINTGIYIRVSTEEQAREGYSIRAQEEKLKSYALLKSWQIFSVYSDEGISGKDIEGRPAVKQLIADVTGGKVNNVLVYKIDRLTRSTKDLIELVELFNKNHCMFNSLQESIDTGSATGRMFLKIVGIFAEFERENLAERIRLGRERKVKEGYTLCAYMPSYGYDRENGNKIQVVNPAEAAIVRRVFNMYLHDDYSLNKILKTLNAEQIPSKTGKKWADRSVKQILTNVTYIGKVRYNVRDESRYMEADGHHEPIIDEDIFYQVQRKIDSLKGITKTKRAGSDVYFCGVLYCPLCGGKYTTKWQYFKGEDGASKVRYPYYYCRTAYKGECDSKVHLGHARMEQAFEEYIGQIADFTETDVETDAPPDNSAEIAIITSELKQIEKKTEEIMNLFVSNNIDFNTYQGMVRLSSGRHGELKSRLDFLQNVQQSTAASYTKADIVTNLRENWSVLDNDQRQQFVQKFIRKIVVHSNRRAVVIDGVEFNEF